MDMKLGGGVGGRCQGHEQGLMLGSGSRSGQSCDIIESRGGRVVRGMKREMDHEASEVGCVECGSYCGNELLPEELLDVLHAVAELSKNIS